MNSYTYTVSLRVRHPSIDPQHISEELGVKANRMWSTVDRPSASETYWSRKLTESKKWLCSDSIELEDFIQKFILQHSEYKKFFAQIRKENGSVELFIGFEIERNCGLVIDHSLSKQLAELEVDLAFDFYPPEIK